MFPILLWIASCWFFWKQGVFSHSAPHPVPAAEFEKRLYENIAEDLHVPVVLEDVLGEGDGAWSSAPRYSDRSVNCIIWMQKMLADTYARTGEDRRLAMDRLRYFGGMVSFGTRKHYTEHFLMLEPAPFKAMDFGVCGKTSHRRVRLDPEIFLRAKKYACPLFAQAQVDFDIEYLQEKELKECAPKLTGRGPLVLFAVPKAAYEKTYLRDSGPMGLVHAMFLQLPGTGAKASNALVYHASTSAGHVLVEQLSPFLERMSKLHSGYALYELDAAWDFRAPSPILDDPGKRSELEQIVQCEKGSRAAAPPAH